MEEIKIRKERERTLEEALCRVAGPSWAEMLNITPYEPISRRTSLLLESTAFVLPSFLETPLLEQSESSFEMDAPTVDASPAHSTLISAHEPPLPTPQSETTLPTLPSLHQADLSTPHPTSPLASSVHSRLPSRRPSLGPDTTGSTIEPKISIVDMEHRLRACEAAIRKLMGTTHAGDLSMIRDELEVEGSLLSAL